MNWFNWKDLISENVVQAFCQTLFHSLWEGALMAIAGAIVILSTKKASSFLRYNLLAALLFAFIAAVGFTFYVSLDTTSAGPIHVQVQSTYQSASNDSQWIPIGDRTLKIIDVVSTYLNSHAFVVVTIWFIIFSFRCFNLLSNFSYSHRMRNQGIHHPDRNWQKKIDQLARHLDIKFKVQLLESELAKVPMVVGFFKPVILFPFSLLCNLPTQQVEAVLLHELAHIKRRDLIVNLFQHLTEILFFFNPAVIWISSQIRNERENCCDDMALAHLHNKTPFLRALVAFQEYTLEQNSYAVGFPGKGNHLLNRVLRIVNNHNKTLTNMEKILLATGIVAIGLATIAFTQAENSKPKIGIPSTTSQTIYQSPAPPKVKIDSVPETKEKPAGVEKSSFLFSRDGKSYRGTRINGKVIELYVDGQKVPDSKLRDYQKVFEEFDRDMKQNAEDLEEKERAVKLEKEAVESQEQAYKVQAEVMALSQADMQAQQLEQARKAEQYNKMALDLAIKQNQIMKVQQDVEVAEINAKLAKVETSPRTVIINGVTYVPASPSVKAISPKAYTAPPAPPTQAASGINDPVYSIIKDLRAEGLISEDLNVNLSFTLNSSKLIVNGTTQPGEIHKRFANKYIHNSKDYIIYSSSKNSTHTDIYVQ